MQAHRAITANLNSGDKRSGVFGITSRNTTPAFKVQKGVFYKMARPVQVFVVAALCDSCEAE